VEADSEFTNAMAEINHEWPGNGSVNEEMEDVRIESGSGRCLKRMIAKFG
jgi:hypothetical protein